MKTPNQNRRTGNREEQGLPPRWRNRVHQTSRAGPRAKREQGFVLLVMAICSIVIFGCLGLAVDIGRMYIAKNEAQAYSDAAALAGALALNGSTAGVTAAQTAATSNTTQWNFGTAAFSGTVVEVATSS